MLQSFCIVKMAFVYSIIDFCDRLQSANRRLEGIDEFSNSFKRTATAGLNTMINSGVKNRNSKKYDKPCPVERLNFF